MITSFSLYEMRLTGGDIQVGDYAILRIIDDPSNIYRLFSDKICVVYNIDEYGSSYEIRLDYKGKMAWFNKEDIELYSSDKSELEIILKSRKFNL